MNKLGFGFLRLPKLNPEDNTSIHWELLYQMVDTFIEGGGTYFDTAYTYLDGMSEVAVKKALAERYPREKFCLADKMPTWKVKEPQDCEKYFKEQCERCGVTWFDVYLLHWLNPENYRIAEKQKEFAFLEKIKAEGRAKKIGFSYHGDSVLLENILTNHPEVDIVQLQINYLDWKDSAIDSKRCYDVAVKYGKEVIVMEPVKGGTLAELPAEASAVLKAIHPEESNASWALRFVQSLEQVSIVLSGMNTMEQMQDNLQKKYPLTEEEYAALDKVCNILNTSIAIPCTACRYCEPHCPKNIPIPDCFKIYNSYHRHPEEDWKIQPVYESITHSKGKASDCIGCRACERNCPQKIKISEWMPKIAKAMEQ